MTQAEYMRTDHKAIQDPCTALKAIDTTLKKITTLESAIKLEKHDDQWSPLYIGIGIGITILSAIGMTAFCLIVTLIVLPMTPVLLLISLLAAVSSFGIAGGLAGILCVATETSENKKTRQDHQKALQQMIDSVSGYNFSELKKGFDTEFAKAQKDEHGKKTVQRLLPLTKITATDYFNLFKRAETALAFN